MARKPERARKESSLVWGRGFAERLRDLQDGDELENDCNPACGLWYTYSGSGLVMYRALFGHIDQSGVTD